MARRKFVGVPSYDKLMIPVLRALVSLGGSGSIEEINEKVYAIEGFSADLLQISHGEKSSYSEIDYRLHWSRTYLKKFGLIDNSSRGVWTLVNSNLDIDVVNTDEIVRFVRNGLNEGEPRNSKSIDSGIDDIVEATDDLITWKEQLIETVLSINPAAFERLVQRLLRESGFVEVEVTGRTGDGGSVTPSQIRDFRGAMQGRADKGIFITTGNFTREARKEATRDGAPPIDLIDGELLCEKLKEFSLGVSTKLVEEVDVDETFFKKF